MTQLTAPALPAAPVMPAPSLGQIKKLQDAVAQMPQVPMEAQHLFAPGMYVRMLPLAAGTVAVGKMHRHVHPAMLIQGSVTVNTERGMERITAPHVWISQANAKRVVLVHEDCIFVTVHLNPDDETDLDKIEAAHIVPEALIDYDAPTTADLLQEVYA